MWRGGGGRAGGKGAVYSLGCWRKPAALWPCASEVVAKDNELLGSFLRTFRKRAPNLQMPILFSSIDLFFPPVKTPEAPTSEPPSQACARVRPRPKVWPRGAGRACSGLRGDHVRNLQRTAVGKFCPFMIP